MSLNNKLGAAREHRISNKLGASTEHKVLVISWNQLRHIGLSNKLGATI